MEPYHQIIPQSQEPVVTLVLNRKTGNIPKGTYGFIECYCTDACDCRRVLILVLNEKQKQKAAISFGFDQEGPFAGPYLDGSNLQSPYAQHLLDFFVEKLNRDHIYLQRLYRHYREVRERVEGKPYRGKPFPKPGQLVYRATPPPDLEAEMLQTLKNLRATGRTPPEPRPTPPKAARETPAAAAKVVRLPTATKPEASIPALVSRYSEALAAGRLELLLTAQNELRSYLRDSGEAGVELARYLPELCRQSPQNDEAITAALRVLFDGLNFIEEQQETEEPGAGPRMEKLQKALAQQVFAENDDLDLKVAVLNILLQSRVDLLPELRKGTAAMIVDARRTDLEELPGEEIMTGISRSLESMGVTSPFEAADEMLQLLALNERDLQVALVGEMLVAGKPLLREMSALMIFTPDPEVRYGVSQLLAAAEGSSITCETLRRLIVSRNWLPEPIRRSVDQAVASARRARVECAPLVRPQAVTLYASTIDGAGEQTFQVVVPDGSVFARCVIVLKQQAGVSKASVVPLKGKGEVNSLTAELKKDAAFIESSPEHLDLRLCHALADAVRSGALPGHWLVRIAELLGRDRWKPIPFDAERELLLLWEELQGIKPKLLEPDEAEASLADSGQWELDGSFLRSWLIEDEEADREMRRSLGRKKFDAAGAFETMVEAALERVLERRRAIWIERLVVTALWLKSCGRPPLPWHRMFHVAQAVADDTLPLREVPLMRHVAEATVQSYVSHLKNGSKPLTARR